MRISYGKLRVPLQRVVERDGRHDVLDAEVSVEVLGENFQAARGFLERMHQRWKGAVTRRADWFFAYSDRSLEPLRRAGFPPERVTVQSTSPRRIGRSAAVRSRVRQLRPPSAV